MENLIGSNFNDTLSAAEFSTGTINSGAGNDTLTASFFEGTLNGGDGNDQLGAGTANGTLNGGAGNDNLGVDNFQGWLNGGDGNDVLEVSGAIADSFATVNGGAGADVIELGVFTTVTCDYNAVSESPAGLGRDKIVGFVGDDAAGDKIDLTTIDANTTVSGNQAFIWGGPFTAGHLQYAGGVLSGNTDADAAAEFQIQLLGAPALFVQAGHPGSDILL
ncbi:MAG: hypothetical protein CV081_03225 [Nitrospira sp. LK265]|nr:hypothetical protein [Nitrospira sp. LK265]